MSDLPKFYSISESARLLGVHPSTLRLWEDQGYLNPSRTPGGDRRYLLSDLEALVRRQGDSRRKENGTTSQSYPPVVQTIGNLRRSLDDLERQVAVPVGISPALGEARFERPIPPPPPAALPPNNQTTKQPDHQSRFSPASALIALLLLLLLGAGAYIYLFPADFQRYVLNPLASSLLSGGARVSGTVRFLSTIFFGETDEYFISPLGDASFRNLKARSITTDYLTVTRSETIAGLNADFLDGQDGSYYLSWENTTGKPTILSSLDNVTSNEGNIDLIASGNITITANDSSNTITFTVPAPAQGSGSGLNADLLDSL